MTSHAHSKERSSEEETDISQAFSRRRSLKSVAAAGAAVAAPQAGLKKLVDAMISESLTGGEAVPFAVLFDTDGSFRLDKIISRSDDSLELEYCDKEGMEPYVGIRCHRDLTIQEIWTDGLAR